MEIEWQIKREPEPKRMRKKSNKFLYEFFLKKKVRMKEKHQNKCTNNIIPERMLMV